MTEVVSAFYLFIFMTGSLIFPVKANELNGRHLTIVTAAFAPYVYIDHDERGNITRVHGFVNEIVLWLASKYNFTYTYIEPNDGFYGAFVNNQWNGMVRMAIDQEVDMIAFSLTPTYARTRVIDFCIPFAEDPVVALIPPPKEVDKIMAAVQPYKPEVWILIIISLFGIAFITCTTMNLMSKYGPAYYFSKYQSNLQFSKHAVAAFGAIICQGQYLPQNVSNSVRIAASSWCLTSVVLVYLYSGCLISFLTIPKMHPVVETLDELAHSNKLEIMTLKTHFFESYLLEATSGAYKKLGDAIRSSPANRLSKEYVKPDKLAEKSVGGQYAILLEKAFFLNVIKDYLKKTEKCGMSIMKEELYQAREAFAIPKGRSYLKLLDQGMNIMRDTGCIDYWHDVKLNTMNKCSAPSNPRRIKVNPLRLSDLVGVFILWLCGVTVSFGCFITETIISFLTKKNKKKRTMRACDTLVSQTVLCCKGENPT